MVEVGGAHNAQVFEYGDQQIAKREQRKILMENPQEDCLRGVTIGSPANRHRGQDHMKDFIRRVIIAALGRLLADLIKRLFGGD